MMIGAQALSAIRRQVLLLDGASLSGQIRPQRCSRGCYAMRQQAGAVSRSLSALSSETEHLSATSKKMMALEREYGAYNYHPLPVVIERGFGTRVWDVEGGEYLDFLAAYSAVNQGHCHPRIVEALTTQAAKLTLTSRAFHNNLLGEFQRRLCTIFGYERCLPMNTGVEGGETAVKLARRWGYAVKGIPPNEACVVFARGNFWGRTLGAISSSSDETCRNGFGPFLPGYQLIDYNDLEQLEEAFKSNPHICAFMVEPIQGEAGVVVPDPGFLKRAQQLCRAYNVLLIADEVQTGLGRTGTMLCSQHEDGVKPDMTILGKALSGGVYPISAVLGSDQVLGLLQPGEHGSTYGGNPLACAVGMAALEVLQEENLCENSTLRGQELRQLLTLDISNNSTFSTTVRGKGLMNALVIESKHGGAGGEEEEGESTTAWDICLEMAKRGVLAKPTHGHIIRLAPPLTITKEEVEHACAVISEALQQVGKDKTS